jgi:hypothetical protein
MEKTERGEGKRRGKEERKRGEEKRRGKEERKRGEEKRRGKEERKRGEGKTTLILKPSFQPQPRHRHSRIAPRPIFLDALLPQSQSQAVTFSGIKHLQN